MENRTPQYDPNDPLMATYQMTLHTALNSQTHPFPPPTGVPGLYPTAPPQATLPLPSSIVPPGITNTPDLGAVTDPELEEMHQRFTHALRCDNTMVMKAEFQNLLFVVALKEEEEVWEQRSEARAVDLRMKLSVSQNWVVELERLLAAREKKEDEAACSGPEAESKGKKETEG